MGNIRTYDDKVGGLEPDNKAAGAAAASGRAWQDALASTGEQIGRGVSELGDAYVKQRTQQQISAGMSQYAAMGSELTQNWDQTIKSADPNDPTTGDKFRDEQVKPRLEKWVDSFDTPEAKMWATQQAAQLSQHFFEKTAADQSLVAGQAAIQNLDAWTTGLKNMVYNDPTGLATALGSTDQTIDALVAQHTNLSPEVAARMKGELRTAIRKDITEAAVEGAARSNPMGLLGELADGKFQGMDVKSLPIDVGHATTIALEFKRQQEADDRAQAAVQRQAQKDDFDAKMSVVYATMYKPDGSIVVPPGFHEQLAVLARHPGADASAIHALEDAASTATKAAINGDYVRTDPGTWQGLTSRIGLPPTDPHALTHKDVDLAYAANKLSGADYSFLSRAVPDASSDPAQQQAMRLINGALERNKSLVTNSNMFSMDKSGDAMYDTLTYDVYQRYNQMVAGGMSPVDAANKLTDPRDPQGIHSLIPHYQTNNKQGLANIRAMTAQAGAQPVPVAPVNPNAAAARKPGETPEQYLARTGGK